MKTNIYKLGEYKITEFYTGELRWETHFGLGELKEGRCYRKGEILFLGPAENHRDGFLKLEFIGHLKAFPLWLKTKYYCDHLEVFHCETGGKVTMEDILLWILDSEMYKGDELNLNNSGQHWDVIDTERSTGNVAFRLQKFEIIKNPDGQIVWKTYGGAGNLRIGMCLIIEDILFIGPMQNEQINFSKREFLGHLELLPEWNETKYFSPRLSLRECGAVIKKQEEGKRWFDKWKSATKTHSVKNIYKKTAEFKSTDSLRRKIPAVEIWRVFDSLANQAGACKSFISKIAAAFNTSSIRKWITIIVAVVYLIILSLTFFLIAYLKKHYKRWHGRKS
ncbi:hypothetical protein ACFL2O_03615 [Thermodesulfobacteriota bacterium]